MYFLLCFIFVSARSNNLHKYTRHRVTQTETKRIKPNHTKLNSLKKYNVHSFSRPCGYVIQKFPFGLHGHGKNQWFSPGEKRIARIWKKRFIRHNDETTESMNESHKKISTLLSNLSHSSFMLVCPCKILTIYFWQTFFVSLFRLVSAVFYHVSVWQ